MTAKAEISARTDGDTTTIRGTGEMDLRCEQEFRRVLDAAAQSENLVIDLRSAFYIDTQIIAAIVVPARVRNKAGHRATILVRAGSQPEYALTIVGLGDLVNIESSSE